MRKTRRRKKKKKTRLCAFSVHNNYALARDRSLSLSLRFSLSFFLFRLPYISGHSRGISLPVSGDTGRAADRVRHPRPLLFLLRPLNSRRNYYCCSLYSLFSLFPFPRLVSHDNYFSYFFLVYTSLYLVKFSKFTIKITCGFFFVSQVVTISPCATKYTIRTR